MARKSRTSITTPDSVPQGKLALAGVYNRLSVEDGDTENNSIANQLKLAMHYLEEHTEIRFVQQYADNGFSGMNYNRPGYRQMLEDLQAGKINCVIVKDVSRLGRHFVSTSELVERIFPSLGVRLICINDNYDSEDAHADPAALTLPLKMVMNDYYVKDISKKIRSGIRAKMDTGEYLPSAGSIPYGYLRNPETVTFDIDPESASIVREIYSLRAQGEAYNSIARILNGRDVPSPARLRYQRGVWKNEKFVDSLWISKTVSKILQDPVYTGTRIHGKVKRDRIGQPKTRRSQEEWQLVENAHEAIISKDLFQRVQEINQAEKERRSHFVVRETVEIDYRPLLHGKVFCADCGNPMVPAKQSGRTGSRAGIFFECRSYKSSLRTRCKCHYVRQELLMGEVIALLDQQVKIAVDVEKLSRDVRQMPKVQSHQRYAKQQLSSVTAKRKGIESKLEKLLVDLAKHTIERDEYDYMRSRYEKQHDELLREEARTSEQINAMESALSSTEQWLQAVKRYQTLPEIDRRVMDSLVEKILVYADRHIRIILRYADPYQALSEFLNEVDQYAG